MLRCRKFGRWRKKLPWKLSKLFPFSKSTDNCVRFWRILTFKIVMLLFASRNVSNKGVGVKVLRTSVDKKLLLIPKSRRFGVGVNKSAFKTKSWLLFKLKVCRFSRFLKAHRLTIEIKLFCKLILSKFGQSANVSARMLSILLLDKSKNWRFLQLLMGFKFDIPTFCALNRLRLGKELKNCSGTTSTVELTISTVRIFALFLPGMWTPVICSSSPTINCKLATSQVYPKAWWSKYRQRPVTSALWPIIGSKNKKLKIFHIFVAVQIEVHKITEFSNENCFYFKQNRW